MGRMMMGLAAAVLVTFTAGSAMAGVLFSEDWSAEDVGDNSNNLTSWAFQAGTATAAAVQLNVADKELYFANNGSTNTTIRTQTSYSLGGESTFSITGTIRNLAGKNGVVGMIAQDGSDSYRFDFHTGTGDFRMFRGGTQLTQLSLTDIQTALGVASLALDQDQVYSFHVTNNGTSTDLALYVNGTLGMTYSDTSASRLSMTQVQIRLMGWNGNNVSYDDISLFAGAPAPEPASLALMGLGGIAMLRRRRHA